MTGDADPVVTVPIPGIRYHQFDLLDVSAPEFYKAYLGGMDAVQTSEQERQEMIEEAKWTFEINIRMNEELMVDAGDENCDGSGIRSSHRAML